MHRHLVGMGLGLLAVALALSLSGCGKKPSFVDPPQGKEADRFPGTYPNPATLGPQPGPQPGPGPGVKFP